jgi:hypothetical protein
MPVAVVGTSSFSHATTNVGSLTFAHTSTGDPLYVCASISGITGEYGSIKYGGISLERVARVVGTAYTHEWWVLHNPPAGTANVVCTLLSGTNWLTAGARNVSGGDLDLFVQNFTSASGSSTAPSITVPSAVNDLVLDMVSQNVNSQGYTPGAGQTTDWAISTTGNDHYSSGSKKAGAASVPMTWTLSTTGNWQHSGISIPAAGTVSPVEARVTQDVAEVLSLPVLPESRVTKYVVEVLGGAIARAWVSQVAVESLHLPATPGRVSQVAVETLYRQPSAPSGPPSGAWMGDGASNPWIE